MTATTGPGLGVRQRKKQLTRETLVICAVELVAERGLAGVTVDDIAAAAGVSSRTFFNYFACKEDAIAGFAADQPTLLVDVLQSRPAEEEPFDAMRAAVLETVDALERGHGQWADRHSLVLRHPELAYRYLAAISQHEAALARAIRERSPATGDLDAHVLVASVLATTRAAIAQWYEDPRDLTLVEMVTRALDHLARGLRPRPR